VDWPNAISADHAFAGPVNANGLPWLTPLFRRSRRHSNRPVESFMKQQSISHTRKKRRRKKFCSVPVKSNPLAHLLRGVPRDCPEIRFSLKKICLSLRVKRALVWPVEW